LIDDDDEEITVSIKITATVFWLCLAASVSAQSADYISPNGYSGLQFSIPLTVRRNTGMEHFFLRGGSQWTYTIESRIFNKDNRITVGSGEIPKIGDPLVQTFNRDRNTTQYYESNIGRIKNAFVNLSTD